MNSLDSIESPVKPIAAVVGERDVVNSAATIAASKEDALVARAPGRPRTFKLGPWVVTWSISPSGLWGSTGENGMARTLLQVALVSYDDGPFERTAVRLVLLRLAVFIA